MKRLEFFKDQCELLMLYYKALHGGVTSHVWRMIIEIIRITKSCESYFDLGNARCRRAFLKRLYVGDVPVSNIFRIVEESNGAFQKRVDRRVDGVKFSNREIIVEWFAYMLCNRLDPRLKAFADEIRDRDLSMANSMRLEHFHDVCSVVLPNDVKKQDTTSYFRAMAYESIVKSFGAVGDGTKAESAFAKLMSRPVTFSRLAECMTLLKLQTMDFQKDIRSASEIKEGDLEDNNTVKEEDSLFDSLKHPYEVRASVFMKLATADVHGDVDHTN